ncbi:gamma-glutamyltransferase [Nocardioides sp.]|uniref:gamma-glutamyltransferase n=1 Tax=Nocardioides sp. TaxID=35761 RepID=UPI0035273012
MTPTRVAVAATGEQALRAGLAVAAEGGNAVDAALAASFVALATEPGMVSLGGGGFVAVWPADGEPVVVDGNVAMPGSEAPAERFGTGLREVVTTYGGGVTMYAGHGSVATPGALPALAQAHERFARLPWPRLLAPATTAARDGYPMSPAASRYLGFVAESLFGRDAEAHALVTRRDGGLLEGGETTSNPLLAEVLDQLAVDGAELFRTGAVGRALVSDMEAHGGLVGAADLTSYRPEVRPAHVLDVGDWRIATNPPPSVGGPMLAVMLGELARRGDWTWNDAIEIQHAVLGYRRDVHDAAADLEAEGRALLDRVTAGGLGALRGSSSTAHISAVDADGNACAVTMSSGYGAGMCIPGTGILLNNTLGEVELNGRGLHAAPPGTRLASNMAPTTGRTADGRVLAIGSPGADRITTALMLVLGQGCLHGADLRHAIAAPRLHVRVGGERVRVEFERDPGLAAAVAAAGLAAEEYAEPHMYFGGVGAAYLRRSGAVEAAGDARREAAVGVSP